MQVIQRRWFVTGEGLNGLGRCLYSVCRLVKVQSCRTVLQVSVGECSWAALLQAKWGDGSPGAEMCWLLRAELQLEEEEETKLGIETKWIRCSDVATMTITRDVRSNLAELLGVRRPATMSRIDREWVQCAD